MMRFPSIAGGVSVIILLSSACSQPARNETRDSRVAPAASPTKQPVKEEWLVGESKVLLSGTFNRETKVLQISHGLPEPKTFENLDTGLNALEEVGYERVGLQRLRSILEDENKEEMWSGLTAEGRLDSSDVLGAFEVTGSVVRFTLFDIDLSKYSKAAQVDAVLEKTPSQSGCERISKSCIKCPNGKIYCVIEKVKRFGDK